MYAFAHRVHQVRPDSARVDGDDARCPEEHSAKNSRSHRVMEHWARLAAKDLRAAGGDRKSMRVRVVSMRPSVASAREALELVEVRRPDVLVSDIGLPDADGYSLIRPIRRREKERMSHNSSSPAKAPVRQPPRQERRSHTRGHHVCCPRHGNHFRLVEEL